MNPISINSLYTHLNDSIESLKKDRSTVSNARITVETALERDEPLYGINTGFGILANKRVNEKQLKQLQRNLILSHAVGVGDLIPKEICRLMLQLKIHALGIGYSGILTG
jgi:histidine ammonia-lyase